MKNFIQTIFYLFVVLIFCNCSNTLVENPISQKNEIDTTGVSLNDVYKLHKKFNLKTYDRSLAEYIKSNINQPDSTRKIIYLLPLGDMETEVELTLKEEVEYLTKFLQLETKILRRVPLDDLKKIEKIETRFVDTDGYIGKGEPNQKEQINANSLVQHFIIPNKPKDAIVILGITDHDIYSKH
jgi:archaemetzincin